ncbi:MAG: hypothetical protein LBH98_06660 [Chitinispirillales bacterium]|nr:hypothetical protein [Chitinispirillales bacterium]
MKKFIFVFTVLLAFTAIYSQDDLKQRSMMKKTIFYVTSDGKTASADYWQLSLGNFDVRVQRKYPGEGMVSIDGSVNAALMSGGYIEGNGFGDRGKLMAMADFAVKRDGKYEIVRADSIDFIFYGGTKAKLKDSDQIEDLFVHIEDPYNTYQPKKFILGIYSGNKNTGELTFMRDVSPLIGISFTTEGAQKAYKAALAE